MSATPLVRDEPMAAGAAARIRPLSMGGVGARRRYAPVMALYVLATLFTDAHFMADTEDFARQVVDLCNGIPHPWDPGHLFWQPLGALAFRAFRPLVQALVGPDMRLGVTWTLLALAWAAGLVAVLSLRGLLASVGVRDGIADLVVAAFVFSHGFLNFAQAGPPYVAGLAALMLGLFLLARAATGAGPSWPAAVAGGACLASAVCLWFPYVLTVPAAVVSPVFFKGADRKRARIVLQAALFAALVAGVAYGLAAADLGISTIGGFREWLLESRHGTENRGVARMVFGLGRSFVSMGDYGMLFKRFLLHDPYNPVSLGALLRSSLWALALFHLVLVSIAVRLLRSADQRRILALAALGSLPLLAFAAHFDGGAIERYLPLYPFVFLALASSLQSRPLSLSGAATVALVAVASMANASGMRSTTLAREQEEAAARMRAVVMRARPMSRVFAVNWQDDLVNFRRSFPLHDLNRRADLRITSLVTPGTAQAAGWRSEFARLALETWQEGGDVWISTRALSPRPRAEWNWVEGADPHLTWPEFPRFFSALEMGERAGGEDGFLRLPPTPGNEHALRAEAR